MQTQFGFVVVGFLVCWLSLAMPGDAGAEGLSAVQASEAGYVDLVLALGPDMTLSAAAKRPAVHSNAAPLGRGLAESLSGSNASALVYYTITVYSRPQSLDARLGRAKLCLRLGLYSQAVADLSAAVKIRPDSAEILYQRAMALVKVDRTMDAYKDFLKANALDARYPKPRLKIENAARKLC